MRSRLLPLLVCPACRGSLRAVTPASPGGDVAAEEVEEGFLTCDCAQLYPVIEGVPRLLPGAAALYPDFFHRKQAVLPEIRVWGALPTPPAEFRETIEPTLRRFEKEWREHDLNGMTWGLDQATRVAHSLRYLNWTEAEVKGKLILDAGAGTGQLTCSLAALGCEMVGIDLSPAVVRGWKYWRNLPPERRGAVHIIQGDLTKPPLRPGSFDGVLSSGVLHHTPDTRQAFRAVAPLVKPDGVLAVWLYRKGVEGYVPLVPFVKRKWASARVSSLRRVTTRLPPNLLYAVILAYAAVFHLLYWLNAKVRSRQHAQSVGERATSLFDSLAPPYVWKHTPEEVRAWYQEAGYEDVRETTLPDDDCGFCMTGVRKA